MRHLSLLAVAFCLLASLSPTVGQVKTTPRFEDFPAQPSHNRPAPALVGKADAFRTRIRDGAKAGPNFAGHYTGVTVGCGSGCMSFVVVDAVTGRVFYVSPFAILGLPYEGTAEGRDYRGLVFRIDSSLLVADGCPEDKDCGTRYYRWEAQ